MSANKSELNKAEAHDLKLATDIKFLGCLVCSKGNKPHLWNGTSKYSLLGALLMCSRMMRLNDIFPVCIYCISSSVWFEDKPIDLETIIHKQNIYSITKQQLRLPCTSLMTCTWFHFTMRSTGFNIFGKCNMVTRVGR